MRTNRILIAVSAMMAIASSAAYAQSIDSVLGSIESNNTTLKALRGETDAIKAESRIGTTLADPSIELGYLWGNGQGDRFDLSVMQEFDFPTAYYWRKQVAKGEISTAEFQYQSQRKEILLEAKTLMIDLGYYHVLTGELKRRLSDAEAISDATQKLYDRGDATVLDLNKAKLNLLTATKQYETAVIDMEAAKADLQRLNGGLAVPSFERTIPMAFLPMDFEEWFEQAASSSPEIRALESESETAKAAVKLVGADGLPRISLGYVSERQDGTSLQGIGGGITIPIWGTPRKARAAKARAQASEAKLEDARSQYYNSLKSMYSKAVSLQKVSSEYRQVLSSLDSNDLLKKALDAGEISLVDYIVETNVWYEALVETLEAERDYASLVARMNSWQL